MLSKLNLPYATVEVAIHTVNDFECGDYWEGLFFYSYDKGDDRIYLLSKYNDIETLSSVPINLIESILESGKARAWRRS